MRSWYNTVSFQEIIEIDTSHVIRECKAWWIFYVDRCNILIWDLLMHISVSELIYQPRTLSWLLLDGPKHTTPTSLTWKAIPWQKCRPIKITSGTLIPFFKTYLCFFPNAFENMSFHIDFYIFRMFSESVMSQGLALEKLSRFLSTFSSNLRNIFVTSNKTPHDRIVVMHRGNCGWWIYKRLWLSDKQYWD